MSSGDPMTGGDEVIIRVPAKSDYVALVLSLIHI